MSTTYKLPLLPLRDVVIFPHMVAPLFVGREKSIRALEEAMKTDKKILLCSQKDAKTNDPGPADIYDVGTIGTIVQMLRLPDGTVKILVEGTVENEDNEEIERDAEVRFVGVKNYFIDGVNSGSIIKNNKGKVIAEIIRIDKSAGYKEFIYNNSLIKILC